MVSTLSSLDTQQDIYSFNGGVRWNFLKKSITSFVGFELLTNHFSKKKITAISNTTVILVGSSARNEFGTTLSGGIGIKLSHALGIEIEGSCAVDNLFSREKSEKTAEDIQFNFISRIT
ncbi:MAG: hypothetical protein COT43_10185 [Candidatus Marinimicrobia bacterium CG08_land_8_20_14_0_20_45_22]|nr:MAG: hypothetical protein COT43_10185 [Candidatus Marinimicrobia bacterium CG08_land_8_20_14_0_20_45_22]